ncbi:MAG: YabP/YqfC family sporulation protein [Clostridia bacterium]|nr:YabP/YqfC family sporulation protein [Clostridia bacterium]
MRLFDEIFKGETLGTARFTQIVGGGGYFEGVKTVGDFTPERIVLYFPSGVLTVEGTGLSIGKYCDGDLRLLGTIRCVRLGEHAEAK